MSTADHASPAPSRDVVDPRGPRFGAAVTSIVLLVTIFFALIDLTAVAFWILLAAAALFAWGAFAGIRRHPYGLFFAAVIRPRLQAPEDYEPIQPPTFAQGVGFAVAALGLILHLLGVPYALVGAAALAFVAAFLNAAFGFCIGCQLFLLLVRLGVIRTRTAVGDGLS